MATESDEIFSGDLPHRFGVEARFRIEAAGRAVSSFTIVV
jgi:hypothetical protein